ncbi:phage tail protein [bacterium D16-50]|nr:phage tail protein [bacterium D16-50]
MANIYELPDKINLFNVYDGKTRLVGVSAEVSLPSFDPLTDTLNVAGLAGEIESEVVGSFGSMKIEIPFENLYEDFFVFAASTNPIVIRGSMEVFNMQTQAKDSRAIVITVKGRTLNINPGTFKKGGKGNPSVTKEITYIKITIDGATQVELDKLNSIFVLGGVDLLAKVRSQI